jgi:hypothetical protein
MGQKELVKESLVGPGLRPRRLETFQYVVEGPVPRDRPPEPGTIVETRAGVYWRVLMVVVIEHDDEPGMLLSFQVALEEVKAHSREAHGSVTYLRGGRLA